MIIEVVKRYAIKCHQSTNHLYDGLPYEFHLKQVYDIALAYIHMIPLGQKMNVLAACWAHDAIEDCRQTYNDVLKVSNETVADLVYALTNEKGKNRAERANEKYYRGIRNTPNATFIKYCDRIANVYHASKTGSKMWAVYKKEHSKFIESLPAPDQDLIAHLETLLEL